MKTTILDAKEIIQSDQLYDPNEVQANREDTKLSPNASERDSTHLTKKK